MSNELNIGGKSFVIDDLKGTLGPVSPVAHKVEHQEHTTSDTLVSVLRPEPKPKAPVRTSSLDPGDMARSRVALLDGLKAGRAGPLSMFVAWLFGGLPAILVGREVWILCTRQLPSFSEEPGKFLLRMMGLVGGEGLPLAAMFVLIIGTLGLFGRRKPSS